MNNALPKQAKRQLDGEKKKGAKILGERIADEVNAHVAQVIGHTALLYRPGFPPVLDLDEPAEKESSSAE